MTFVLTSRAFDQGKAVPAKYTCDGDDVSPPLEWRDPPAGTRSFALVSDDPDAPVGVWVHWVLYDLPASTRSLAEDVAPDAELPGGGRQGVNSWGRSGYGGPCPPGGTHRYFFKLYALDALLQLAPGAGKDEVLRRMEGHVVGEAELMGIYARQ